MTPPAGLWVPPEGPQHLETTNVTTAADGTTITSDAATNTKGTATQLIASSAYHAYGITVMVANVASAGSTNARVLADIMIGSGLATVLIPNLLAGNVASQGAASGQGCLYYFPIFIPAGTRIGARCQDAVGSDTVSVSVWLHQWPRGAMWCGSRVTAYGVDTANSRGTSHSPGNGSYATATEITASATNAIRAMQLGIDLLSDTTGATARGLVRVGIGSTPTYVASDLPFHESTTIESIDFTQANMILSQMRFAIPAATRLVVSAMRNATAEGRGFALYGVD